MYYQMEGNSKPLLLIHGLGYDSSTWELQKSFSSRFRLVTMDLRGHGRTTKPRGAYSVELFANDIKSLCDFLSIQKTNMLGISMGGCVALRFALLYPECVSSLVLVNTFARIETKNYRDAHKLAVRKYLMSLFSMERLASISAERLFSRNTVFYELAYRKFLENDRSCYLRSSHATFRFDCLTELKNLKIPTLIITGRNDRVVSTRHAIRLHEGIKSSILIFLEGGHALPVENPSEFNNTVLHFLEG